MVVNKIPGKTQRAGDMIKRLQRYDECEHEEEGKCDLSRDLLELRRVAYAARSRNSVTVEVAKHKGRLRRMPKRHCSLLSQMRHEDDERASGWDESVNRCSLDVHLGALAAKGALGAHLARHDGKGEDAEEDAIEDEKTPKRRKSNKVSRCQGDVQRRKASPRSGKSLPMRDVMEAIRQSEERDDARRGAENCTQDKRFGQTARAEEEEEDKRKGATNMT
ncbi:hypothetical protein R3P38DRAFT_2800034 [Favolaschia claudopus]|uniref:Uncharacterized protein n=1 Tax=Favolaschia claudopus TaxID=2862362 RepID=A0AAV9ZYI6_9AGAR